MQHLKSQLSAKVAVDEQLHAIHHAIMQFEQKSHRIDKQDAQVQVRIENILDIFATISTNGEQKTAQ